MLVTSCICFGLIRVCCVLRCHVLVCAVEPPTAFPLCEHWCTVGVHAGTSVPSDAQAGWHRGQSANSVLVLRRRGTRIRKLELWSW